MGWWRSWRESRELLRAMTGLRVRLRRVETRLIHRKRTLQGMERRLVSLSESLAEDLAITETEFRAIQAELEEVGRRQKRHEAEMDSLRSRIRVAEDVTIPVLVAANKLALERYDADTAVQIKRQVSQS